LVGARVDEGWACESVAEFGEVASEREVGEVTVAATPGRNGDAEGCAGPELRMDVFEKAGDDVIAVADDFFEFGG
jgi:hypothetical protein